MGMPLFKVLVWDMISFINRCRIRLAMGRIKTQLIKRAATNIVKTFGPSLNSNFDENKAFITPYLKVGSKKLKNSIIGYATRLVKLHKVE